MRDAARASPRRGKSRGASVDGAAASVNLVYDVPILATIYSVWALARVRDLLAGRANEVPFGMFPRLTLLTASARAPAEPGPLNG